VQRIAVILHAFMLTFPSFRGPISCLARRLQFDRGAAVSIAVARIACFDLPKVVFWLDEYMTNLRHVRRQLTATIFGPWAFLGTNI